jgi:hypothetical protein
MARPHVQRFKACIRAFGIGLACLLSHGLEAQPVSGVPSMSTPIAPGSTSGAKSTRATPPGASSVRTIGWEVLVPADWDPMKDLKGLNLSILSDADPRAAAALTKLREAWDNAPINNAMIGQLVRLPGYLVPLEETKEGIKEFLLVPYFGACIHSPPPPANQIVHVLPKTAAKGLRSMDTVWVTGVLAAVRTDSYMGVSGYRIEATQVAPYAERPAR